MKDRLDTLLWLLVGFAAISWLAFAWTSYTGLTFVGRVSHRGRPATAEDVSRGKNIAVISTVLALPAAYALLTRKR